MLTEFDSSIFSTPKKNKSIPDDWNARGNLNLLKQPVWAIFVSRQSLSINSQTWWFQAVKEVLLLFQKHKQVPIVGDEILYLDVISHLATFITNTIIVSSQEKSLANFTISEQKKNCFLFPKMQNSMRKMIRFHQRDNFIESLADGIVIVAARKNGSMLKLAQKAIKKRKKIISLKPPNLSKSFEGNICLLEKGAKLLRLNINIPKKNRYISSNYLRKKTLLIDDEDSIQGKYLWHFTRPFPGPWLKQSWEDYIADLLQNNKLAEHNAIDSLCNILKEKIIFSSASMIRGEIPVVCFTSANPKVLLKMKQYNPALKRWNFHPFAVGLLFSKAVKQGVKQVIYGDENTWNKLLIDQQYLFQPARSKINTGWEYEKEWRAKGDFSLKNFKSNEIIVLIENNKFLPKIESYSKKIPIKVL